jgi:DNA repair protein RadC
VIIGDARAAADLLGPHFADPVGERVMIAHLDSVRRLIALTGPHRGGEADIELPIRTVIMEALELGSAAFIIAHNHPSGDPRPSSDDIAATRRLASTAAELGIRLYDHIIYGGGTYRSFRELGLL